MLMLRSNVTQHRLQKLQHTEPVRPGSDPPAALLIPTTTLLPPLGLGVRQRHPQEARVPATQLHTQEAGQDGVLNYSWTPEPEPQNVVSTSNINPMVLVGPQLYNEDLDLNPL